MPEQPTCVAVLLCEMILEDRRSNNRSFINAFNAIYAPAMPATHGRLCVLVSMTDVVGAHEITIQIRNPSSAIILNLGVPLQAADPLDTLDHVVEILNVQFNEYGGYYVDVLCDGRHVGSRKFSVIQSQSAPS